MTKAILPKDQCGNRAFMLSIRTLAKTAPALRGKIVKALTGCILADGFVTEREAELIRAVSAHFHCPMPTCGLPGEVVQRREGCP